MNATDFIQFLGHSSLYKPFDNFLTRQDITWRPNASESLNLRYIIYEKGIEIDFISALKMSLQQKAKAIIFLNI